jgi:hypothetical protein
VEGREEEMEQTIGFQNKKKRLQPISFVNFASGCSRREEETSICSKEGLKFFVGG